MLLRLCASVLLITACVDDTSTDSQASTDPAADHDCPPPPPPGPPPQEALDACASLSLDAACAFDIDDHHIEGTCKNGPEGDGPLACAPARR
jgi:hypothetical protein